MINTIISITIDITAYFIADPAKYSYLVAMNDQHSKMRAYKLQLSKELNIPIELLYQNLLMDNSNVSIHFDFSESLSADPVAMHTHLFWEFVYTTKGNLYYSLSGKRYRIIPGSLIVIPPGVEHMPLLTDSMSEDYERYSLWIDTAYIKQLYTISDSFRNIFSNIKGSVIRLKEGSFLSLFEAMFKADSEKKAAYPLLIQAKATELLYAIARSTHDGYTEFIGGPESLIDNVLEYLDEHIAEKLSIEEIADKFNISPSSLSHNFRKRMGLSLYSYLIQHRLMKARARMMAGSSPGEAWQGLGFSDYSSFYRHFVSNYGTTPIAYKKLVDLSL